MSVPFSAGERVLLVDRKGRKYALQLSPEGEFHTHTGHVRHSSVIGRTEGSIVVGTGGTRYVVVRPTLADTVVGMPRGAQVIYPKDLGAMVVAADIHCGARVLEAGVGSGALSMMMLSTGATVVGYEVREDFANRARRNVADRFGPNADYRVEIRDVYEGVDGGEVFDRMVLDLPEPWRAVPVAAGCLRSGGILCCYVPTVNQVAEVRRELDRSSFGLAETFEVLHRTWHVEGRSIRPDHRMIAHTGFITSARLLQEGDWGRPPA